MAGVLQSAQTAKQPTELPCEAAYRSSMLAITHDMRSPTSGKSTLEQISQQGRRASQAAHLVGGGNMPGGPHVFHKACWDLPVYGYPGLCRDPVNLRPGQEAHRGRLVAGVVPQQAAQQRAHGGSCAACYPLHPIKPRRSAQALSAADSSNARLVSAAA